MSAPARIVLCTAALVLAGCATSPRQNISGVPNWESPASNRIPPSSGVASSAPAIASQAPVAQTNHANGLRPGANGQEPGSTSLVSLEEWARGTGAGEVTQLSGGPGAAFSLHSRCGTLVLRTGSLAAQWDGTELRLGFAPVQIGRQPFVHALDLNKTIRPLLEPASLDRNGVIVIDPGHGGSDPGTRSIMGGPNEKDYALDWALRLRNLLVGQGWEVLLTRSNDVDLAVTNRVAYAAYHRASLFLSLHFNSASPNHSEAGLETYCLTPAGMPSSLTRGYGDDPSQAFANNAFDAANLALAMRVHRSLLQANGHHDRGVRRARFPAVLRGQQCPAVLVEGGYLSNEREARQIADPAHRQLLAEAVARALQPLPSSP